MRCSTPHALDGGSIAHGNAYTPVFSTDVLPCQRAGAPEEIPMPTRNKPADEPEERAVGEVVDLSRIDAEIRRQREALAAHRRELDELKAGRLSTQSLEVLLTDLSDIWTNTGQLVGLERQQRDEL